LWVVVVDRAVAVALLSHEQVDKVLLGKEIMAQTVTLILHFMAVAVAVLEKLVIQMDLATAETAYPHL
jgi:hypothetical protein